MTKDKPQRVTESVQNGLFFYTQNVTRRISMLHCNRTQPETTTFRWLKTKKLAETVIY